MRELLHIAADLTTIAATLACFAASAISFIRGDWKTGWTLAMLAIIAASVIR